VPDNRAGGAQIHSNLLQHSPSRRNVGDPPGDLPAHRVSAELTIDPILRRRPDPRRPVGRAARAPDPRGDAVRDGGGARHRAHPDAAGDRARQSASPPTPSIR
jgi:hypothetical protein